MHWYSIIIILRDHLRSHDNFWLKLIDQVFRNTSTSKMIWLMKIYMSIWNETIFLFLSISVTPKKTRTNIHQTISDISKESKFTCVCRSCGVLRFIFLYIDILLLLLLIRLVMVVIHNQIFMSEDLYRGFFSTRLSIGLRITLDIANFIRNLLKDVHVSLSVSLCLHDMFGATWMDAWRVWTHHPDVNICKIEHMLMICTLRDHCSSKW